MNPIKAFVTTLFVKDNDVSKIDESTFYDIEMHMVIKCGHFVILKMHSSIKCESFMM